MLRYRQERMTNRHPFPHLSPFTFSHNIVGYSNYVQHKGMHGECYEKYCRHKHMPAACETKLLLTHMIGLIDMICAKFNDTHDRVQVRCRLMRGPRSLNRANWLKPHLAHEQIIQIA
jgi:hypothetical protein